MQRGVIDPGAVFVTDATESSGKITCVNDTVRIIILVVDQMRPKQLQEMRMSPRQCDDTIDNGGIDGERRAVLVRPLDSLHQFVMQKFLGLGDGKWVESNCLIEETSNSRVLVNHLLEERAHTSK